MDKKISTSVFLSRPGSLSLKVTIPEFIVDHLDIRPDDALVWQLQAGSKKRAIVEVSKAVHPSPQTYKFMSEGASNLLEHILKERAEDRELYEEFKRLVPRIKKQQFTATLSK
jgi:hypothetical protein